MSGSENPSSSAFPVARMRVDLLAGLIIGFLSFVLAEALVPNTVQRISDHDRLLAIRLGFVYVPLTALCVDGIFVMGWPVWYWDLRKACF
jgi:hypothetical protein